MYEKLYNYINKHATLPLNSEEELFIEKAFQIKKLRKK